MNVIKEENGILTFRFPSARQEKRAKGEYASLSEEEKRADRRERVRRSRERSKLNGKAQIKKELKTIQRKERELERRRTIRSENTLNKMKERISKVERNRILYKLSDNATDEERRAVLHEGNKQVKNEKS